MARILQQNHQIHLAQQQNVAYNSPRCAILQTRGHGYRSRGFVECFDNTPCHRNAKEQHTTLRRTPAPSVRT
jgi:hypothetical protein